MSMSWSPYELSSKGILYVPEPTEVGQCPPHVESLRACLLDFSYPLPGFSQSSTLESLVEHAEMHPKTDNRTVRAATEIQREATRLARNDFAETDWAALFHTQFFDKLASCTLPPGEKSRISSRNHFYYDAIVRENDQLWEVFRGRSGYDLQKCPKPDVAFYLPVYDTDPTSAKDSAIAFRDRHWEQLPSTAMAEPFTWSTLHMLSTEAGLRPCPRKMSGGYKKTKAGARLRCYPWLIAEFKKAHHDLGDAARADEIVCCQASNAAACALQLNKELAQFARPLTSTAHVPPIPVVTTTGSKITVWIAYYAKDVKSSDRFACSHYKASYKKAYIMQAIWKGDITILKDIFAFQLVLENIYTWAIRVFKPLVASYIDQWKHKYWKQMEPETLQDVPEQLENYEKAIRMVNSLAKEYEEIEFETQQGGHPVDSLRFSLVLQQMARADHKKLLENIDRIITEKLQREVRAPARITWGTADHEPPQRSHSQAASDEDRTERTATRSGSSYGSDGDSPGTSDYEGTQTTRASQTAPHTPNLRRSTRSNQGMYNSRVDDDPLGNPVTSDTEKANDGAVTPDSTPKVCGTTRIDLTATETDIEASTASVSVTSDCSPDTYFRNTSKATTLTIPRANPNIKPTPPTTPGAPCPSPQASGPRAGIPTSPSPVGTDPTHSSIGTATHNSSKESPPLKGAQFALPAFGKNAHLFSFRAPIPQHRHSPSGSTPKTQDVGESSKDKPLPRRLFGTPPKAPNAGDSSEDTPLPRRLFGTPTKAPNAGESSDDTPLPRDLFGTAHKASNADKPLPRGIFGTLTKALNAGESSEDTPRPRGLFGTAYMAPNAGESSEDKPLPQGLFSTPSKAPNAGVLFPQ